MENEATNKREGKIELLLVIFMLTLYTLTFSGHYVVGDHTYRLAWAKALLRDGTNDISAFAPGTKYSIYGIGHTLIHVPILFASQTIERVTGIRCEGPINMYPYVVNGVLGVWLIYRIARRYGVAPGAAARRAAAVGIGSVWFPYTKLEYSETLVATGLLGMWLAAPVRPLLAGFLGGFVVSIRTEALLFAGVTACFAASPRTIVRIILGALPGIALTMYANWVRTGQVYTSGYNLGDFDNPVWVGLYGMIFSAGKSIFLFTPLLLLTWGAARRVAVLPGGGRFGAWALTLLTIQIVFYSAWWDWSGDDNWGVRFVVAGVMASLALLTVGWPSGLSPVVLITLGIFVQIPAVLIGPHTVILVQAANHPSKQLLYLNSQGPITSDDLRYHPRYSQVVASWELLAAKLGVTQRATAKPVMVGTGWLEGFTAPPKIDWDIFWLRLGRR